MATGEDIDLMEKARAEHFIEEIPMMEEIESARVELGEDHTGDPAMWLVFRLKPGVQFDYATADRFNDYAAVIQTKILHSGMKRFPYTRLE